MEDNAGTYVRQGQTGTGAAQVLPPNRTDPLGRFYRAKYAGQPDPEALQAQRNAENKAWDTMLDHDPEKAWAIFENEVFDDAKRVRQATLNYRSGGGRPTDMQFRVGNKNAWEAVDLKSRYSNEMKDNFLKARELAKSNKDYYDWDAYNNDMNSTLFYEDENGNRRPRPIYSLDKEAFEKPATNSDNFNMTNIWKDALEVFPEQIDATFEKWGDDALMQQKKVELKAQLMKYDDYGLPVLKNGLPVINMDVNDPDDRAKQILMGNDWVRTYVEQQRERGTPEAEIWQTPMDMLKLSVKRSEGSTQMQYAPKHYLDRASGADFNFETTDSPDRKITVVDNKGEKRKVDIYVPREYSLGGTKMDKPLRIKSRFVWNLEEGSKEPGYVGDREMVITSLQLLPWNYGSQNMAALSKDIKNQTELEIPADTLSSGEDAIKTYIQENYPQYDVDKQTEQVMKLVEDKGHIRYGNPKALQLEQLTNPNMGVRWVAQGQMMQPDGTEKQVLVPYEDVRGKLKSATGFDLDQVPLHQRHHEEIVDLVKQYFIEQGVNPSAKDILAMAKRIVDEEIEEF